MMIFNKIWFVIVIMLVLISCDTHEIKQVKYMVDDIALSCSGVYVKNKLSKIVCLNLNQDTILVENFKNGVKEGLYIRYFDSGQVLERGVNGNGIPIGVWQRYYKNGRIENYRYYKKSLIYYGKYYKQNGDLLKSNIPVRIRITNNSNEFIIGETYNLFIDLKYSEFDSVNCIGILNKALDSGLKSDTTNFAGRFLHYEFTPKYEGKHVISGILLELDAVKNYKDEKTIAERPFKFEYVGCK